jgi:hypothetical protein
MKKILSVKVNPYLGKIMVDALRIKEGPTESGVLSQRVPETVGGELIPFDLLASIPKHWLILVVLLLPLAIILYKKRNVTVPLITRFLYS